MMEDSLNDCSSKDDKPLIPLDKYGKPLELPKSNTTNNHEQQIYRLRSRGCW
jgi:hypothetical protein